MLRLADIAITAQHYLDQKERVTFGMGSASDAGKRVPMPQSAGTTARALRKLSSRYGKFEKCCESHIPLLVFRRQQILLDYGRSPSDDRQRDTIRRIIARPDDARPAQLLSKATSMNFLCD